jgi:hypothetical protein
LPVLHGRTDKGARDAFNLTGASRRLLSSRANVWRCLSKRGDGRACDALECPESSRELAITGKTSPQESNPLRRASAAVMR